jgi:hypothetical protein|tara:strand:- start:1737 stop:2816 length:1080 start_codon:yes stop_codon:yes gene_type:complete
MVIYNLICKFQQPSGGNVVNIDEKYTDKGNAESNMRSKGRAYNGWIGGCNINEIKEPIDERKESGQTIPYYSIPYFLDQLTEPHKADYYEPATGKYYGITVTRGSSYPSAEAMLVSLKVAAPLDPPKGKAQGELCNPFSGFTAKYFSESERQSLVNQGYISEDLSLCQITPPPPTPLPTFDDKEGIGVKYDIDGDEINVWVSIQNNAGDTREYRAFVYSPSGTLLDSEPDLTWANIKSGASRTLLVTSKWDFSWDINSVNPLFRVRIYEQERGYVGGRIVDISIGSIYDDDPSSNEVPNHAPPTADTRKQPTDESGGIYTPPRENGGWFGGGGLLGGGGEAIVAGIAAIALIMAFSRRR